MKRFAQLFRELDQTTRTNEKVAALEQYFRDAEPADAAWALHFLLGRRGRRAVKVTSLREWAAAETGLPLWLVEESYDTVGDLAETLALLLAGRLGSATNNAAPAFHVLLEEHLLPLGTLSEQGQRESLFATLALLDTTERLLFLKLLTGGFRMGVSRTLVVRVLASIAGVAPAIMEHRLMSDWRPSADAFSRLLDAKADARDPAQPYPFYLASPLELNARPFNEIEGWQVEWKWDGIRAQLIRRGGQVVLWSRGEEIITPAFPEICEAARALPEGTVLDGELLAWRGESPLPFSSLQRRLNRREAAARLRDEVPAVFMAYDLLEHRGEDWRARTFGERRATLDKLIGSAQASWMDRANPIDEDHRSQGELFANETSALSAVPQSADPTSGGLRPFPIRLSACLPVSTMDDLVALRASARSAGAEGLMLKRVDSPYGVGRERGAWWKWKVDPYTIDAVLLAAQPGHGKRAGLFTDYTFGIWRGPELVSFAKAYSGLDANEIEQIDQWVRAHTTGRHGPVRTVVPELVFELAFEGVQESVRHKSGLALRFPRIARWRRDKPAAEADTVESLRNLLESGR